MKSLRNAFTVCACLCVSHGVVADELAKIGFNFPASESLDTTEWQCEYCIKPQQLQIDLRANFAHLSDDAFQFTHFNGAETGNSIFLDGSVSYVNKEATYFSFDALNTGLDSVDFDSQFGSYGRYKLVVDYSEIPIRRNQNLFTPFNNAVNNSSANSNLTLPNGWTFFGGANPPSITPAWSTFDLASDWQRFKISWQQNANKQFDYQLNFQRIEKTGLQEFSSAQIWNTSYLPMPLDQQIDQLDGKLNFTGNEWWGSLSYQVSTFNNRNESLLISNPFQSLVVGSETSQIATAPDNQAYKLGVNFNYNLAKSSWIKLRASVGQMTQDETFLPYSTNQSFSNNLPASSLDGKVDTQDFSIRWYSHLTSSISLRAKYAFHDQDNKSQQLVYQGVVGDSFIGDEITNLPYDYTTRKYSLGGDWRFLPGQLFSLEFAGDSRERNISRVSETTNFGARSSLRLTDSSGIQLNINLSQFDRDATQLETVDLLSVNENPLMQRYSQADRQEDKAGFQLTLLPNDLFSVSFSGNYTLLDYTDSDIGLQKNQLVNYALDFNWQISQNSDWSVFYQTEKVELNMAASQSFSSADWYANNQDKIRTAGSTWRIKQLLDKRMDLSFELSKSDADSEIILTNGSTDSLPSLSSEWTTAKVRMEYRYSSRWTFQLRYQLDEFVSDDYAIDGVLPGTVSNLLTFGAASRNYDVNYVVASVSYHFDG